MSGGIAYIYDTEHQFPDRCNTEMVALEEPNATDIATIRQLLENHLKFTGSTVAAEILKDFEKEIRLFVKVMPTDYRRVLEKQAEAEQKTRQPAKSPA
jgi:glutamate synthase domain-containing protein 3